MSVARLQSRDAGSAAADTLAETSGMTEASDIAAAGYEVGNTLGEGFFAKVVEVKHVASGRQLAAKVLNAESFEDDDEAVEALHVEIDAMRAARHPNVVELHEVVATPEAVYLVMEKLEGGELFERAQEHGAFDEAQAKHILVQLLQAAAHCHEKGLVHRDLKLENVLFDSHEPMARVKLIDFGYAAWLPESRKVGGLAGTPDYVAPEVITWYGDESDGEEYGMEVDIWSIGVILYILLSGHPPFSGEDEDELVDQVRQGAVEYPPSVWDEISPEAKDLVSRCLSKDPTLRPTAREALQHSWLRAGPEALTEGQTQHHGGGSKVEPPPLAEASAEDSAADPARASSSYEEQQPTGASPPNSRLSEQSRLSEHSRQSDSAPTGAAPTDPAPRKGALKGVVVDEPALAQEGAQTKMSMNQKPTCEEPRAAPVSVIRAAPPSTDSTHLVEDSALLAAQPSGTEMLQERIQSVRRSCNAGSDSSIRKVPLEGTSDASSNASSGCLAEPTAPLKMSLTGKAAAFEVLSSFQVPERDGVFMRVDASTFKELYRLCDNLRLAGAMEPNGNEAFAQLMHDLPQLCKAEDSALSADAAAGGA